MNKSCISKFILFFQVQPWKELILINRFIVVGCIATIVHISFAWALINYIQLSSLLANFIAYIMAFGISFTGNFYWTFCNSGNPYKALKRFFFISIIAFIVNSLVLMKLLSTSSLGAEIAIVAAAGIIPVITFIVSKLWIYKDYENAK